MTGINRRIETTMAKSATMANQRGRDVMVKSPRGNSLRAAKRRGSAQRVRSPRGSDPRAASLHGNARMARGRRAKNVTAKDVTAIGAVHLGVMLRSGVMANREDPMVAAMSRGCGPAKGAPRAATPQHPNAKPRRIETRTVRSLCALTTMRPRFRRRFFLISWIGLPVLSSRL